MMLSSKCSQYGNIGKLIQIHVLPHWIRIYNHIRIFMYACLCIYIDIMVFIARHYISYRVSESTLHRKINYTF